ncbi:MAG: DNA cytosine methyltransferase [Armatimonadetes bacterium]|nr:DNA cytosine methyltransferase [Armatimonadota bacterium]
MNYLSFFSGALGLDQGLDRSGWHCLGANEIDAITLQTIRANRPDLPVIPDDIRNITPARLRDELGSMALKVDAIVGGPPCQAFSTAGRRRGLEDDRGNVFLHFVDLAIGINPRFVVVENVRGLLSAALVHRPHSERGDQYPPLSDDEQKGGALKRIVEKFQAAGYSVSFRLYDTSRFGVPQIRERVVLIAQQDGGPVPHLIPTHDEPITIRQAISDLDCEHEFRPLRSKQLPFLPFVGPGENWRSLPPDLQKEALGNAFHSGGGRTGFLRRVNWEAPSPTLVTDPTMPATLLAHPEELRPLSVQEYQRLQTFPDNWKICGSTAQKYRQLGNAVPVLFGEAIARHLQAYAAGITKRPGRATSRYHDTDEQAWAQSVGF